jgi:hypothetical protein
MGDALHELLASRILGKGYMRMQPQIHASMSPEFRPVERAMAMLPEPTQDTMPDIKVDTREIPFGWYDRQTEARINRNDPRAGITLVGGADSFKDAQKGNETATKKLASLLVHEKYHLDHEPGEGPAYDAQLETLKALHAPASLIDCPLEESCPTSPSCPTTRRRSSRILISTRIGVRVPSASRLSRVRPALRRRPLRAVPGSRPRP